MIQSCDDMFLLECTDGEKTEATRLDAESIRAACEASLRRLPQSSRLEFFARFDDCSSSF